jgi:fatty-acid desaturase
VRDTISFLMWGCVLCWLQIRSMMCVNSVVGMFGYMFLMSKDTNFRSCFRGISFRSEINCVF